MQVTNENVKEILSRLWGCESIAVDTETTGLRPYHGDRLFSIVVFSSAGGFYFPVTETKALVESGCEALSPDSTDLLKSYFANRPIKMYMHNAKFDMRHLYCAGFTIHKDSVIHDTIVSSRLLDTEMDSYSLDACALRFLGERKDDKVMEYITKNHLWDWVTVEGISTRPKAMYFDQVPQDLIVPYAIQDTALTYKLGKYHDRRIAELDKQLLPLRGDSYKNLRDLMDHEIRLTRTIFDMEHRGVKVDVSLCKKRIAEETDKIENAKRGFEKETGEVYRSSHILFSRVCEKAGISVDGFSRTESGLPSFSGDTFKNIPNEFAKHVATIKDAKTNVNFYSGFIWNADEKEIIHTDFKQSGTVTGRLAARDPNLQNLKKSDKDSDSTDTVRQALIPYSSEYCLVMIDYDQMEYRLMLDYAGQMDLIEKIKSGLDVHQATADKIGISRNQSKTLNFALLYGSGKSNVAKMLGITVDEAGRLIREYFSALPNVERFISAAKAAPPMKRVLGAGSEFVWTWCGRPIHYNRNKDYYKAPNHVIQGGCADVVRIAMVRCDTLLKGTKSSMTLMIHDELVFNVHYTELDVITKLKGIMETSYPERYLPLTASVSHSWKSLGDKVKGYPTLPQGLA